MKKSKTVMSYRGNSFSLSEQNFGGLAITDIQAGTRVLRLPEEYGKKAIYTLMLPDTLKVPQVKTLYIPKGIRFLWLSNLAFPNLTQVQIEEGSFFQTDGRMIYSHKGTHLVYSLAGGNLPKVTIPKEVGFIESTAFTNSYASSIECQNPRTLVAPGAFDGSSWLSHQEALYAGGTLLQLCKKVDTLRLPEGVTQIGTAAFATFTPRRLIAPTTLVVHDPFDNGKALEVFRTYFHNTSPKGGHDPLEELELVGPGEISFEKNLSYWKELSTITVRKNDRGYLSADGVLFQDGGKTLRYYPPMRADPSYQVPEGTEELKGNSFARNTCLRRLSLPGSLRHIQAGSFYNSLFLQSIDLSDSIEVLESGTFSRCYSLTQIRLPRNLKHLREKVFLGSGLKEVLLPDGLLTIGEEAFYFTGISQIYLPPSLRSLGKAALHGITQVTAMEGTAKGLMGSLFPSHRDTIDCTVRITVLDRRTGLPIRTLLLPSATKSLHLEALNRSWDGEQFSPSDYSAIWDETYPQEEAILLAAILLVNLPLEKTGTYLDYLKGKEEELGTALLHFGDASLFRQILDLLPYTRRNLETLLQECNALHLTAFIPYILQKGRMTDGNYSAFPL